MNKCKRRLVLRPGCRALIHSDSELINVWPTVADLVKNTNWNLVKHKRLASVLVISSELPGEPEVPRKRACLVIFNDSDGKRVIGYVYSYGLVEVNSEFDEPDFVCKGRK